MKVETTMREEWTGREGSEREWEGRGWVVKEK